MGERLPLHEIVDKALAIPKFIGARLVGGAWSELPPLAALEAPQETPLPEINRMYEHKGY